MLTSTINFRPGDHDECVRFVAEKSVARNLLRERLREPVVRLLRPPIHAEMEISLVSNGYTHHNLTSLTDEHVGYLCM